MEKQFAFPKKSRTIFTEDHGDIYVVDSLSEILDDIIKQLQYKK